MPKTQLKPSPIQVHSHEWEELSIVATEAEEHGSGGLELSSAFFKNTDNPRRWQILMTIELVSPKDGPPPPYTGKIRVRGDYEIHEKYPHDPERLISITGCSMLYGAAREMLAQFTSRSANGMLFLPSVSFHEDRPIKKKAAKKTKTRKSAKS